MKAILIIIALICCVVVGGSIKINSKPLKNDIYALHIHEQMKSYMAIDLFPDKPTVKTIKRNFKLKGKR